MTTPEPKSAPAIRWGILGAGGIAHKMADAIIHHTAGELVAVGSRTPGKAETFVAEVGAGTPYGSYEEVVNDPSVDAVYVATTHNDHHEPALLAIEAGKHVLVEKAFTQNVAQAERVIAAARAKGVYVQEAMWSRFLPHQAEIRAIIERGDIGQVISVQADHGQHLTHVERMVRPELAGGALLDLGVYPIAFAHDILGVPESITAVGQLRDTGVDGQVSMVFQYDGAQATLHTTMEAVTGVTAVIAGTEGRIEIDSMFYTPTTFTVKRNDGTSWTYDGRVPNGFQYEAAELARNVAAGRTESEILPLDQTLEIMRLMDEVRDQIGLVYPNEK
ncbi:Gfo/Idh/MocA family protein [Demequina activiva]|uniref:Oxidoreductase n=1 Tax=Demequina activiva TaxID=1582364 RepID=A0A919Q0L2_9MICO|nr:Gfo/Idh/MocA family oxidoreductase [Demequina activiva]GIG53809.1 oxidoreductase [Demequina activiva]